MNIAFIVVLAAFLLICDNVSSGPIIRRMRPNHMSEIAQKVPRGSTRGKGTTNSKAAHEVRWIDVKGRKASLRDMKKHYNQVCPLLQKTTITNILLLNEGLSFLTDKKYLYKKCDSG